MLLIELDSETDIRTLIRVLFIEYDLILSNTVEIIFEDENQRNDYNS